MAWPPSELSRPEAQQFLSNSRVNNSMGDHTVQCLRPTSSDVIRTVNSQGSKLSYNVGKKSDLIII